MPARLIVHGPLHPARVFRLEEGGDYVLGRDPGCGLPVEDDRVSRSHARFRFEDGTWILEDLGSKNGTALLGHPVQQRALGEPAWISFGGLMAHFEPHASGEEAALPARWQSSSEHLRRLDPALNLDTLLDHLMESVLSLSGATRGFVLLRSPEGELQLVRAAGVDPGELEDQRFSGSLGAVARALETGAPVVLSDAQRDAHLGARPSIAEGGIRTLVCLPIQIFQRVIGAVYADSPKAGETFTELDVAMLEALVAQAAVALWAARLEGETRRLMAQVARDLGEQAPLLEPLRQAWTQAMEPLPAGLRAEGGLRRAWAGVVAAFRRGGP